MARARLSGGESTSCRFNDSRRASESHPARPGELRKSPESGGFVRATATLRRMARSLVYTRSPAVPSVEIAPVDSSNEG
jgi:hypothetical protein